MNKLRKATAIFAAVWVFLLILDGKTALLGAQKGISLCLRTVIPSLFPFFLLTGMLSSSLMGTGLGILRPVGRFLKLPEGTEVLLIPAFLGGYPAGAKAAADAYEKNQLSREDAIRFLFFGSNAGPAFLFGMGGLLFPRPWQIFSLWTGHLTAALMLGAMLPEAKHHAVPNKNQAHFSLSGCMNSAIQAMAAVCGWVILFRLVLAFLSRWFLWRLPIWGQALLSGLLELTNGTVLLAALPEFPLRFLIFTVLLSFGGICVAMQTLSVLKGLPIRTYLLGKAFQLLFSLLFSIGILYGFWHIFLVLCLLLLATQRQREKSSGNSLPSGV